MISNGISGAIHAYAKRICRILTRIGVLSGTGIRLDRQFHAAVRLYRCDPVNERVRNYRQSDMVVGLWGQAAGSARSRPSRLETEAPALSRWLSSGHKSLLLLAPFGAGKSVVLETFARRLSEDLLDASRISGKPSARIVPLPVRLRAWKWHEDEPFEKFLFRSQTVLEESEDGLLPPEVFRHLLKTGGILPLLDGLDELPGGFDSRDGASPRERAMSEVRRLVFQEHSTRCVVASRPGYGVDADPLFARDDRLTISEYTEAEIRTYINSRFAAAEEKNTRIAAVQTFARAEPDIKEILSRPLFLAAWCDRVSRSPTSDVHTLTDIMRGLVAIAIDPARMKHAIGLPTEQALLFQSESVTQNAILQRLPTLGALLSAFASRGFGEALWMGDVIKQTHTSVPGIPAEEVERLIFICTQAGFVTLLENGEAFAIKVPVVEFLVGQFLASESNRDDCGSFLQTFRRWVWLPELHDCLFFAMETIRGAVPDKRWIAEDCCQWLLNVSAAGGADAGEITPLADDVLRPFIVLAARLGADLRSAAVNLVQHRFLADAYYENVAVPILSGLRGPFIMPYVKELLYVASDDEAHSRRVQETLRVAGPRVVGEHVPDFVQAVAHYPLSDNQIELRCEIAIEDALARLPEAAVQALVAQWFDELPDATAVRHKRLQIAISIAAHRIEREAAAAAVEDWVVRLESAAPTMRPVIYEVIEGFAGRTVEADAERYFESWTQLASSTSDPTSSGWRRAVHAVAGCLPASDAERILWAGVDKITRTPESANNALYFAYCEVARRVPDGTGYQIVRELLARMALHSVAMQDTLAMIVVGAAERIALGDATQTVTLLRSAITGPCAEAAGKLADALEETCRRLPEDKICSTINDLLVWMQNERGEIDALLARAVLAAARNVPERSVVDLIETLLDHLTQFDESVEETLERAILAALTRCPEMDMRPLVTNWLRRSTTLDRTATLTIMVTMAAQKQSSASAFQAATGWLQAMLKNDPDTVLAYAEGSRQAASKLTSSEALVAVRRWRQLIEREQDASLKKDIWNTLWSAAARLAPLDAKELIAHWSAQGADADGLRLASFQPGLAAQVKTVTPTRSLQFEYRWRSDPDLLLDHALVFIPTRLRDFTSMSTESANASPVNSARALHPYKIEEQLWWKLIPQSRDVSTPELIAFAKDVDIVLLTATDVEVEAVLRELKPPPRRRSIIKGSVEQETYYVGRFGQCLAAVTKCRMGALDAGAAILATQHALRVWRPRAVIMVGIAFGGDPLKQCIADVLVASQVISYEPQRLGESHLIPRGPHIPANTTLLNRFENVPHWAFFRPDGTQCKRHVGPILSGEKLIDDPAFKTALFARYPHAVGGDMEGAGLAAATGRQGLPWLLIKGICDWADGTKQKSHQPLAAAAAVSLVKHVLVQIGALDGLAKPNR